MERCGNCGIPINNDNNPLSIDQIKLISEEELNKLSLNYGTCCYPSGNLHSRNKVQITRDMASDAGDPNLEDQ